MAKKVKENNEMVSFEFHKFDGIMAASYNGETILNIDECGISQTACGDTEVMIKFKIKSPRVFSFETQAKTEEQKRVDW